MRVALFVAVVGFTGAGVLAQGQPEKAAEPALKGPTVSTPARKPTLVEKDFSGKLKRLEAPAEEVALRHMKIDEMSRAKIDTILSERAAIIDKAVIEDIDLVVQIANAGQSGDKAEALKLFQTFAKKLEPLKVRGKMMEEIAAAVPEDQRDKYRAMVKEYHEAIVQDSMQQARAKGEAMTLRQATGKELLTAIGQEIKRSYERQISGRNADYEKLLASLSLKPEQERKIRNMVSDFGQKTKLNATAEQRRELFIKIYKELDQEQRKGLLAYYKEAK